MFFYLICAFAAVLLTCPLIFVFFMWKEGDLNTGEYLDTDYKVEYNVDGCMGDAWYTALDFDGKQAVNLSFAAAVRLKKEWSKKDKRNEYRVVRVTSQLMEV